MRRLLDACGLPFLATKPRLLVAGTNGKGTTCALLESALRRSGLKTGLYTSPHLVHPGERIRVSGVPVSEQQLATLVARADSAASLALPDATFFELLTAVGFIAFEDAGTDVDVVEVGLGGRLDSTNVISPTVSILTSVGLDHTEILGPTTEAIGSEKAWVSRRNRPFVLGSVDANARKGVNNTLRQTGGLCLDAWDAKHLDERGRAIALASARTLDTNLACALVALFAFEKETGLTFSDAALARGLASSFWPGRFDARRVQGVEVVFDAAHNAHGLSYFLNQWNSRRAGSPRPIVVYGSLKDKNWDEILKPLSQFACHIFFSSAESPRAVAPETLASRYHSCLAGHMEGAVATHETAPTLFEALCKAIERGKRDALPCVVIGSIALIGEAMERLEVDPFDAQH